MGFRKMDRRLGYESSESATAHRMCNPARTVRVTWRGKVATLRIAPGSGDTISVYRDAPGSTCYVLGVSEHFPYIGAERFDLDAEPDRFGYLHPVADVFLQGSEQAEEWLGRDWADRSDWCNLAHLAEHLEP